MEKKSKLQYLPYILLYFISIFLIGTLDTVKGTFVFSRIAEPDFWKVFVTLNAANWIALLATFSLGLQKIIESKEKKYQELINVEVDKISDPYIRMKRSLIFLLNRLDAGISIWLLTYNRDRKIRAYKRKYQKKLAKLEDKTSYDNKMIYKYLVAEKEVPDKWKKRLRLNIFKFWRWGKGPKRYYARRRRLDQLLSDEYIQANIDYMYIKYSQIKENFLRVGLNTSKGEEDNTPRSAFSKKFFDLLPRFLLGTSFTLFVSSFLFEAQAPTWGMAFAVGLKFAMLLWNITTGRLYSETFFKEHVEFHEQMRVNILTTYFHETKKKTDTVLVQAPEN